MNKSFWKITLLVVITSCANPLVSDKTEDDTSAISLNDKNKDDTNNADSTNKIQTETQNLTVINAIHANGTRSIGRFYDTIVNGIIIGDTLSVGKKLGNILPEINDIEKSDYGILKRCCVYNKSQTQMLTLYFLPDESFLFYYMQVESTDGKAMERSLTLPDSEFVTGKGVKLGMEEKTFLKLFGGPSETTRSPYGITKYSYQQYDGAYYGDYYFSKGILTKFKFGKELISCI